MDFTSVQREGAESRRIEIRERSQTGWRSRGMHEPQEAEVNENDNPVLKDLHARINNNLTGIGFDGSKR